MPAHCGDARIDRCGHDRAVARRRAHRQHRSRRNRARERPYCSAGKRPPGRRLSGRIRNRTAAGGFAAVEPAQRPGLAAQCRRRSGQRFARTRRLPGELPPLAARRAVRERSQRLQAKLSEEEIRMKAPLRVIPTLALACWCAAAAAQGWSPQKNVEIVVGSAPGGSNDKTARTVERIVVSNKLVNASLAVVNKPGGGSNIAFTYVSQHPGDAHYLLVGTPSLLTNHIVGLSPLNYTDFTPIASLFNDFVVFAASPASPIRSGKDLTERLKKDPKSVTIGFATVLGSHNHIAA